MNHLLHPTYFPNIATLAVLAHKNCIWETQDNYQKQTYRNRCHICTDAGLHKLNIPIHHVGGTHGRQKYKEVRIKNEYLWQRQHWRTLQTAYRTSPYFEFYEDELAPLFNRPYQFLMDFNFEAIRLLCECLQLLRPQAETSTYEVEVHDKVDVRFLVNAKKEPDLSQKKYDQVFMERHGFVGNTSGLDLLFNLGPNAKNYLENQSLQFLHA
ncbi:MAG: WbqC family protein [Flavobacteriaceae bacterium]